MNSFHKTIQFPITSQSSNVHQSDLTHSSSKKKKLRRSKSKNNEQSVSSSKENHRKTAETQFFVFEDFVKGKYQKTKDKVTKKNEKQNQREPTPCKTRNSISFYTQMIRKNQLHKTQAFETGVEVNELKKEVESLKRKETRLRAEMKILEDGNKNLCNMVSQLKENLRKQKEKNKQNQKNISYLHKSILEAENNLQSANRNFQKLQKQIKANQISSLKAIIQKLQSQNKLAALENSKLISKIQDITNQRHNIQQKLQTLANTHKTSHQRESYLHEEISKLQKKIELDKNSHIRHLESKVTALMQNRQILMDRVDRLQIELDFMNRKNLEQYKLCMKKKNDMISSLKKKNQLLMLQIDNLKEEIKDHNFDKNLKSITTSDSRSYLAQKSRHQARGRRQSVIQADHSRSKSRHLDELIDFCLSPE